MQETIDSIMSDIGELGGTVSYEEHASFFWQISREYTGAAKVYKLSHSAAPIRAIDVAFPAGIWTDEIQRDGHYQRARETLTWYRDQLKHWRARDISLGMARYWDF